MHSAGIVATRPHADRRPIETRNTHDMSEAAVTRDFRTTPYWWEAAPLDPCADPSPEVPERADVAVIGGGLSGLTVALHLARGGLDTVVFDADRPGEHASTRNFGAIGRTIRPKFTDLVERGGLEFAVRVYEEAKAWVEHTADFIEREGIDCRFRRDGRVVGAHSPGAYDAAARELEATARHLDVQTGMVPRAEQSRELGSDVYHGGCVLADVGHLDPARYHAGVRQRAVDAGARIVPGTRVTAVERGANRFRVSTARGVVNAEQVVLATNAETGADHALFRYFRRRIVPVAVYSAVTEPLPPGLVGEILPRARTVLETRRLYTALRPVVGEDRLLAVGQHLVNHRSEAVAAAALRRDLAVRYPQLAPVRFSHVWRGRFAVTFDWLPHLGTHEGVHYLHGLVGAGVPACGYLGHKLAQRILSRPNRDTVFADRRYPQRFGYRGSTWFLPLLGRWYRALDRREAGLPR